MQVAGIYMELRPEAGAQLHSQLCSAAHAAAELKALAPYDSGAASKQAQDALHDDAARNPDSLMQLPGSVAPLNGHAAAEGARGERDPFAVVPGAWDSGSGEAALQRRQSAEAAAAGKGGAPLWDVEQGQQQQGGIAAHWRPGGSLEPVPARHNGHPAMASAPDLAQAAEHAGRASQRLREDGWRGGSYMRSHSLTGPMYIPGSVLGGFPNPARSALPVPARQDTAVQPRNSSLQSNAAADRGSEDPLQRVIMGRGRASVGSGPRQGAAAAGAGSEQQQDASGAQSTPSTWLFSRNASFKAPDNPWG